MAQRQLLGARKHEGGGEKGIPQERQGEKKVKQVKKKIWWVTNKMKNEGIKKRKHRKGRESGGVYGISSSGLSVHCQMCWGGSC